MTEHAMPDEPATPAPISLTQQKLAVLRAIDILKETYPARIAQQKATAKGSAMHLSWLTAALQTLDSADKGLDVRPDLKG